MDARRDQPNTPPDRPIVTTNEARQGTTGHNVRYVLIVATASVIVLFAVIYAYFFGR